MSFHRHVLHYRDNDRKMRHADFSTMEAALSFTIGMLSEKEGCPMSIWQHSSCLLDFKRFRDISVDDLLEKLRALRRRYKGEKELPRLSAGKDSNVIDVDTNEVKETPRLL